MKIMIKVLVIFSNDNSDRSYDWSYVLLIQAFLKPAFCNNG